MLRKSLFLFRFFRDKELLNYAAALSFYTILSLIPLLLVSFSIFTQISSFKVYYQRFKAIIFSFLLPTHKDLIASYLDSFLQNSVNLGIVGLIAMIITSLSFFQGYELVVSKITKEPAKSLWQSISSYWTLITLTPLGLGLSFYISGFIQDTLNSFSLGLNIYELLPFFIVMALFFVSFSSSIQQRMPLKIIFASSFVSSFVWYFGKMIFVYYVVYNKTYLNVYGSFSVLLFFFLWIYISWIIYLLGLKACILLNIQKPVEVKKTRKRTIKTKE